MSPLVPHSSAMEPSKPIPLSAAKTRRSTCGRLPGRRWLSARWTWLCGGRLADGVAEVGLLDVHVEEVGHDFDIGAANSVAEFDGLLYAVEHRSS